jgi:hypothetical protein
MAAGASVNVNSISVDRMLRNMMASTTPTAIAAYLSTVAHPRLARRARERFQSEGDDAVGGKWVPLKQSTLEIKSALGYGRKKINERTGHLKDSIVNSRPVLGHNGFGETLDFPGNWDRPDLFHRHMQAAGAYNTARPVLGLEYENDVSHMMVSLQQWVVRGKGAVS